MTRLKKFLAWLNYDGPDESNAATRYEIQWQVEHCAECKRLHKATISCEKCKAQGGDK